MDDPEAVIGAELGPGERLLWAGPARKGLYVRPQNWFEIVFGLVWCGMIGTAMVATVVEQQPGGSVGTVFLGGFLCVGLYFMGGRLLIDRWRRSRTHYGITNERILIVRGSSHKTVRSLNLDTLPEMILAEKPNGSGTITFGPMPPWWVWNAGYDWTGSDWTVLPQFELAEAVRPVYEVIREARRSLRESR